MVNKEIARLLELLGPLPTVADVQQLDEFLQSSQTVTADDDRRKVLGYLTQPSLRLVWAQPPEAGQDCVQNVELRLPAVLRGLQPRLQIRFPDRLMQFNGRDTGFRQQPLDYQLVPESLWRATLQFRLGEDFRGSFLWQFRIDFADCWGHAKLHRHFECQYTAIIGRNEFGKTTLEITVDDFSNVQLPPAGKWSHVKVSASRNANVLSVLEQFDPSVTSPGSSEDGAGRAESVIIEPSMRHQQNPFWQSPLGIRPPCVVTPRVPCLNESGSIRGSWPDVLTADFCITRSAQVVRPVLLRLHAALELKLGRSAEYADRGGRKFRNDIVTDLTSADFPELSQDQLNDRRRTISSANTELAVTDGLLIVRNTGTPDSIPGYTAVSYSVAAKEQNERLRERGDEHPIDVRSQQISEIHLQCGTGYLNREEGSPMFSGYRLRIRTVPSWDDDETNGWDTPEDFTGLIGDIPGLTKKAGNHGLDALLISHQVPTRHEKPVDVMLLRQLWLRGDGFPIEDLNHDKPRDSAVARLLIGRSGGGTGRVIFLQSLRGEGLSVRCAGANSGEMQARTRDLVPLHDGDMVMFRTNEGVQWTAAFHVRRSAMA